MTRVLSTFMVDLLDNHNDTMTRFPKREVVIVTNNASLVLVINEISPSLDFLGFSQQLNKAQEILTRTATDYKELGISLNDRKPCKDSPSYAKTNFLLLMR